jgi:hypothetical protein
MGGVDTNPFQENWQDCTKTDAAENNQRQGGCHRDSFGEARLEKYCSTESSNAQNH